MVTSSSLLIIKTIKTIDFSTNFLRDSEFQSKIELLEKISSTLWKIFPYLIFFHLSRVPISTVRFSKSTRMPICVKYRFSVLQFRINLSSFKWTNQGIWIFTSKCRPFQTEDHIDSQTFRVFFRIFANFFCLKFSGKEHELHPRDLDKPSIVVTPCEGPLNVGKKRDLPDAKIPHTACPSRNWPVLDLHRSAFSLFFFLLLRISFPLLFFI